MLREQIEAWLKDTNARKTLLVKSIPQKGLYYSDEEPGKWIVYLAVPDREVNEPRENYKKGIAKTFSPGRMATTKGIDVSHIKYIAAVVDTWVYGLYPVMSVGTKEFPNVTPSHRLVFNLGDFCAFEEGPMKYGIYQNALRGVSMTMEEVRERRVKTSHIDKI